MDRDPGEIYRELTREFGEPVYDRVEAPATPEQKEILEKLSPQQVRSSELAGEKDLCGELPGSGSSAPDPGGSPDDCQRCTGGVGSGEEIMSDQTRVSHPIYNLLPTEIEGFDSLAELALDTWPTAREASHP